MSNQLSVKRPPDVLVHERCPSKYEPEVHNRTQLKTKCSFSEIKLWNKNSPQPGVKSEKWVKMKALVRGTIKAQRLF